MTPLSGSSQRPHLGPCVCKGLGDPALVQERLTSPGHGPASVGRNWTGKMSGGAVSFPVWLRTACKRSAAPPKSNTTEGGPA